MAIVCWFTFEAINTQLEVYEEWTLWGLHLRWLQNDKDQLALFQTRKWSTCLSLLYLIGSTWERSIMQRSKPVEHFSTIMLIYIVISIYSNWSRNYSPFSYFCHNLLHSVRNISSKRNRTLCLSLHIISCNLFSISHL